VGTPYHLEYPEGDDEPSTINLADDERVAGIVDGWLGSPHPRCRLFAVDLLGQGDLPGRMEKLKRALEDPWAVDFTANTSPWQERYYPVRQAAVRALRELGAPREKLESVELGAPNTQYRRVPLAWPLALFPIAGVITYVWLRRRRVGRGLAIFRAVGVMSLAVAAVAGIGWVRGQWVADDFITVRPPMLVSVTSFGGGVQVLVGMDAVVPLPLMHTAMTPDAGGVDFIVESDRIFWHQFGSVFSMTGGRFQGVTEAHFDKVAEMEDPARPMDMNALTRFDLHDVRRWVVPYRDVLPVTLLLPLACAGQIGWVWQRGRRRRRGGQCVGCGYDVRTQAGKTGARCPECGAAVA
jgi:hypothetical protein